MKRAFVDIHQSHAVDEARAKLKHQTLLQEYLQLQKEFVSQKRKLQTAKQNREICLAEVRFLRRRRRYLLKFQSPKLEEDLVQPHNSHMARKMVETKKKFSADEAPLGSTYSVLNSNPDMRVEEEGREIEQIGREPLRIEKKSRNWLIDDKRVRKKKISWKDQMPLKV